MVEVVVVDPVGREVVVVVEVPGSVVVVVVVVDDAIAGAELRSGPEVNVAMTRTAAALDRQRDQEGFTRSI